MTSSNWLSVRLLGSGTEGRELNTFNQPRGVVFDPLTREIFVTDCNNHRIQVFQYDTLAFVRQIGKGNQGSGPGQMNYSVGICIDNGNRVYVADTNNHRVSIFNRVTGEYVKSIGCLGSTPGLFNSPYGVAVDNCTGNLFVTDYDNNRIQVLDAEGNFIRMIGSGKGSNPGQLNQPICACIDEETGYVYVADYSNNRIQLFHKDSGEYITQLNGQPNGVDTLSGPRGLCIAANYLFISDRENHRIQIFDKIKLEFVRHLGLGGAGNLAGQFNRPMELCANIEDGSLIIVDGYNHRVQIIEISELQPQKMIARKKIRIKQRAEARARLLIPASKLAVNIAYDDMIYTIDNATKSYMITCDHIGSLYSFLIDDQSIPDILQPYQPTLAYHVIDNHHMISDHESIQHKQAASMMSLIRETAKCNPTSPSPSQFVPMIIAFDHLIKRNWHPQHIDDDIIEILINILVNINHDNVGEDEEYTDIFRSIVNLLLVISKGNKIHALTIFRLTSTALRQQCSSNHHDGDSDVNDIWYGMIYLLAEVMHTIIHVATPTTSSYNQKESLALQRDIFKFIYGSKLVGRILAGRGNDAILRSPVVSPNTTPKRGLSKASDDHVSTSFANVIDSINKFHTIVCNLLDITNILVNMHDTSVIPTSSKSTASLSGNKMAALQASLLERFIMFFQSANDTSSDPTSSIPRELYRGQRHVWQEHECFQVGDLLDCMDKERSWFESYVTDIIPDGSIVVHFMGWGSKWDDVVTIEEQSSRIAPLNSKTNNWRAELFEGGLIEIKCNDDTVNQKWMWGKILALDVSEAWVDVAYAFGSDATINKRLDLFGENICPIGMHTKEKSKVAAALVIKPAKKIEESIKARLNSNNSYAGDTCFIDAEDDYIETYPMIPSHHQQHQQPLSLACSLNPMHMFTAKGLEYIAMVMFDAIMKIMVDFMESSCHLCNVSPSTYDIHDDVHDEHAYRSCRLLLCMIVDSPYRPLLARFIIRPFIVRCGLRAKLVSKSSLSSIISHSSSSSIHHILSLDEIMRVVGMMEAYHMTCVSALRGAFDDVLQPQIINKLEGKLHMTIIRCSMMKLMQMMTQPIHTSSSPSSSVIIDLIPIFKEYIASYDRSSSYGHHVRKILYYSFRIASYDELKRLQALWLEAITQHVSDTCQSEYDAYIIVHNIDSIAAELGMMDASMMTLYDTLLSRLIIILSSCRAISKIEFVDTQVNQVSVDDAYRAGVNRLYKHIIHGIYKALACRISSLLEDDAYMTNSNNMMTMQERTTSLEALQDLMLTLPSYGMRDMHHYYAQQLSYRLMHDRFVSLSLEHTALNMFDATGCSKSLSILSDYDDAHQHDYAFQKQTITNYDHHTSLSTTVNHHHIEQAAAQMIINGDVNIRNQSHTLWPKSGQYLSYSDMILPPLLRHIQDQYRRFYHHHHPSRSLDWCYSYGKVEIKCTMMTASSRCAYEMIIDCDEAQAVVLLAYQTTNSTSMSSSDLRSITGLTPDQLSSIISALSLSSVPLLHHQHVPVDRVSFSEVFLSHDFLHHVDDDYITKRSKRCIVLKLPSSHHHGNNSMQDSYYHDRISQLVDAAIVRVLKRASLSSSKVHVDIDMISPSSSPLSASPYLTYDKLFTSVCHDIQQHHKTTRGMMYALVRVRCEYLVSANIIDCFAIKRAADEVGNMISIPSESNYLYSYIMPTIMQQPISSSLSSTVGKDDVCTATAIHTSSSHDNPSQAIDNANDDVFVRLVKIANMNIPSISQPTPPILSEARCILDTSATNESKENTLAELIQLIETNSSTGQNIHDIVSISPSMFTEMIMREAMKQPSSIFHANDHHQSDVSSMKQAEHMIISFMNSSFSEIIISMMKQLFSLHYEASCQRSTSAEHLDHLNRYKTTYSSIINTLSSNIHHLNDSHQTIMTETHATSHDVVLDMYHMMHPSTQQHVLSMYANLSHDHITINPADTHLHWLDEHPVSCFQLISMLRPNISTDSLKQVALIMHIDPNLIINHHDISPSAASTSSTMSQESTYHRHISTSFASIEDTYTESPKRVDDEECKDSQPASSQTAASGFHHHATSSGQSGNHHHDEEQRCDMSLRAFTIIMIWSCMHHCTGPNITSHQSPNFFHQALSLPSDMLSFGENHNHHHMLSSSSSEMISFGLSTPTHNSSNNSSKSDRKKKRNKLSTSTPSSHSIAASHHVSRQHHNVDSNSHSFMSIGIPTTAGKRLQLESSSSFMHTGEGLISTVSSTTSSPSSLILRASLTPPSYDAMKDKTPTRASPSFIFNEAKQPSSTSSSQHCVAPPIFEFKAPTPTSTSYPHNQQHSNPQLPANIMLFMAELDKFMSSMHIIDHHDDVMHDSSSYQMTINQVQSYVNVVDRHAQVVFKDLSLQVKLAELIAVDDDNAGSWLLGWDMMSVSSLIILCFAQLDKNHDGMLTSDDFDHHHEVITKQLSSMRITNHPSTSPSTASNPATCIVSKRDKDMVSSSSSSPIKQQHAFHSSSSQAVRAFFTQYRVHSHDSNHHHASDSLSLDHARIMLLAMIQQVMDVCHDLEPDLIMELLPYFQFDVRLLIDAYYDAPSSSSRLNLHHLINVLSCHHIITSSYNNHDVDVCVPSNSSSHIKCMKCCKSSGDFASASCKHHYYCKSCWIQYLDLSSTDHHSIRCPSSSSAANNHHDDVTCMCFGRVSGAIIEFCYDRERRLQHIHHRFENLSNKLHLHYLSSRHYNNDHQPRHHRAMLSQAGYERCQHCHRYRHYPASCDMMSSYLQDQAIQDPTSIINIHHHHHYQRLSRKPNTMTIICHHKYLEYDHHFHICQQASSYYHDLIDASIPPTNHQHHLISYDMISHDGHHMYMISYLYMHHLMKAWQMLMNSYSLLAHMEVMKKHVKIMSEPTMSMMLEMLEERTHVIYAMMKNMWIKPSSSSSSSSSMLYDDDNIIEQHVVGLSTIIDAIIHEVDDMMRRVVDDHRYRLSDNLFGRRVDHSSRQRNLLNDMMLGEYLRDDIISLPLSYMHWSTHDHDIRDLMAIMHPNTTSSDMIVGNRDDHQVTSWDVSAHRFGSNHDIHVPSSTSLHANHNHNLSLGNMNKPVSSPRLVNTNMAVNTGRNSIYLIQQRLHLISKALSHLASSSFASFHHMNSNTHNTCIYMMKYLTIIFYYHADHHISLSNIHAASYDDIDSKHDNVSIINKRIYDILLDASLYKSIITIMSSCIQAHGCYEVEMTCFMTLIAGFECVPGLSAVLIAIPAFHDIMAVESSRRANRLSSTISSIDVNREAMIAKVMLGCIYDAQHHDTIASATVGTNMYLPQHHRLACVSRLACYVASYLDAISIHDEKVHDKIFSIRLGVYHHISLQDVVIWINAMLSSSDSDLHVDEIMSSLHYAVKFYFIINSKSHDHISSPHHDALMESLSSMIRSCSSMLHVAVSIDRGMMHEIDSLLHHVMLPMETEARIINIFAVVNTICNKMLTIPSDDSIIHVHHLIIHLLMMILHVSTNTTMTRKPEDDKIGLDSEALLLQTHSHVPNNHADQAESLRSIIAFCQQIVQQG